MLVWIKYSEFRMVVTVSMDLKSPILTAIADLDANSENEIHNTPIILDLILFTLRYYGNY